MAHIKTGGGIPAQPIGNTPNRSDSSSFRVIFMRDLESRTGMSLAPEIRAEIRHADWKDKELKPLQQESAQKMKSIKDQFKQIMASRDKDYKNYLQQVESTSISHEQKLPGTARSVRTPAGPKRFRIDEGKNAEKEIPHRHSEVDQLLQFIGNEEKALGESKKSKSKQKQASSLPPRKLSQAEESEHQDLLKHIDDEQAKLGAKKSKAPPKPVNSEGTNASNLTEDDLIAALMEDRLEPAPKQVQPGKFLSAPAAEPGPVEKNPSEPAKDAQTASASRKTQLEKRGQLQRKEKSAHLVRTEPYWSEEIKQRIAQLSHPDCPSYAVGQLKQAILTCRPFILQLNASAEDDAFLMKMLGTKAQEPIKNFFGEGKGTTQFDQQFSKVVETLKRVLNDPKNVEPLKQQAKDDPSPMAFRS